MFLSRSWRERDLQRRLELWAPLIGEKATRTAARGRWYLQAAFVLSATWAALNIALEATGLTGAPIVVGVVLFWPLLLFCLVRSVRLQLRASRQAGEVAGTSDKARPPVKSVASFEIWQKKSKYSRRPGGVGNERS